MSASALLWALVGGAVLGLLGKLLAPGDRDRVPLWATTLAGITGILGAAWAWDAFVTSPPGRPDWWRDTVLVASGAALVALVSWLTGRRR